MRKIIIILICVLLPEGIVTANELLRFEPISKKDYPALVFIEENANPDPNLVVQGNLYVASFSDGKINLQKIISSHYIQSTQLSDSVFLVQANEYPYADYEKWRRSIYLVNFESGKSVLLSKSESRDKLVHFFCIRSDLTRNKAVIIRYGQGTENPQLFEIDLITLQKKLLYTVHQQNINLPLPQLKISPDLSHLAVILGPNNNHKYTLKIIDLKTMKTVDLDEQINVRIGLYSSLYSSIIFGAPPFEWINNNEILYQDMLPSEFDISVGDIGTYILKCANIKTKKISEWVPRTMPLTLNGGSIVLNPFTENIDYMYGQYIVDVKNRSLFPNNTAFSIIRNYGTKPSEIYYQGRMIYKGDLSNCCISHSSNSIAILVNPGSKLPDSGIKVSINGDENLIQVKEISNNAYLVGWIEDTNSLRIKLF